MHRHVFGREKHDAGVHWTLRDYSRGKKLISIYFVLRKLLPIVKVNCYIWFIN